LMRPGPTETRVTDNPHRLTWQRDFGLADGGTRAAAQEFCSQWGWASAFPP